MEAPTRFRWISTRPPLAGFTALPTCPQERPVHPRHPQGCRLYPRIHHPRYGGTVRPCLNSCRMLEGHTEAPTPSNSLSSDFCGNGASGDAVWSFSSPGASRAKFLHATYFGAGGDGGASEPAENAGCSASGTLFYGASPRSARRISAHHCFQCYGGSRGGRRDIDRSWKHHDIFDLGQVCLRWESSADGNGLWQDKRAGQ